MQYFYQQKYCKNIRILVSMTYKTAPNPLKYGDFVTEVSPHEGYTEYTDNRKEGNKYVST